jgi:hypothetical protein
MLGRTILDTYYEILFDNLPVNSLETILLGKNQQKCRIKVRSYHLINYSHSLRTRSANYHHQRSVPSAHVSEQRALEQTSASSSRQHQHHHQQQQPNTRIVNRNSDDNNKTTKPKSAPALKTHDRPSFDHVKEQKSSSNGSSIEKPIQPSVSTENHSPQNLPTTPMSANIPSSDTSLSSNSTSEPLLFRAIQDSNQLQQSSEDIPPLSTQYSDPIMPDQKIWEPMPSQQFQTSCT